MAKLPWILSAALGLIVIVEGAQIASTRRAVGDLEMRIGRVEWKQKEWVRRETTARTGEGIPATRAKNEEAASDPKRETPAPETKPQASSTKHEAPTASPLTADEMREIIEQRVDEKVKSHQGEDDGFGGKKRPLGDVAKELGLDPQATKQVAEYADEGKREVFNLLKTPRADGTNLVDDILAAFKSDKPQENVKAQFMRIFRENVPGMQETYVATVLRISEGVLQKFSAVLTPDQLTAFKHTGVGPLDLETGFDPFAEYMKGR